MSRKEKALSLFRGKYNCCQSVVGAFEDQLNDKKDYLLDAAFGFGGGMGRLQLTCGAATGAIMVLSSLEEKNKEDAKDSLNNKIQLFAEAFQTELGEMNCKNLINYNLRDEKEAQQARENDVFEKKCTTYVATAVEILEKIIAENKDR